MVLRLDHDCAGGVERAAGRFVCTDQLAPSEAALLAHRGARASAIVQYLVERVVLEDVVFGVQGLKDICVVDDDTGDPLVSCWRPTP
ncbi:hypothetical protein A0H81_08839 [Grifola frondosa]|uniref:Uncharacterized protein n=1 Tax=Grifola frondosa TaxID=5627 RepID=A0A1C7M9E5_GRIFR|nr:hypothetical protein A0H81_08839 [Grifola frondosa]